MSVAEGIAFRGIALCNARRPNGKVPGNIALEIAGSIPALATMKTSMVMLGSVRIAEIITWASNPKILVVMNGSTIRDVRLWVDSVPDAIQLLKSKLPEHCPEFQLVDEVPL